MVVMVVIIVPHSSIPYLPHGVAPLLNLHIGPSENQLATLSLEP